MSRESLRARSQRFFGSHGRFCASHPWEVIVTIVTLTVCALSMSVLSGGKVGTFCGPSKPCQAKPKAEENSDTVMLSIVNSLAVIYIYNQFSNLRKAGSKYLLGIAGLFTVFASFVFGSSVVNFIDEKVSGFNEALPFFLLLIDLSKASALAKYAFKSRDKHEVRENIAQGIAVLGPTMTLDTLVEVLLIGIGTISGVRQLEMMCCFGCMSIIANYLVFMTFFPASLALVLEVCPTDPSNPTWHLDELARSMHEEDRSKPNPVVQRVKVIMALGLCVVHLHSRFLSDVTGLSFGLPSSASPATEEELLLTPGGEGPGEGEIDKIPLQEYLLWKMFNLSIDQLITVLLASLLFVKYIFFDKSEMFVSSTPSTPAVSNGKTNGKLPSPTSVPQSLVCPLAEPPLTLRRRQGLSITVPDNGRRHMMTHSNGALGSGQLEKLLSEKIIVSAADVSPLQRGQPALLAPVETASGPQELSAAVAKATDSYPSNPLPLKSSATVGTQTELVEEEEEAPSMFIVGSRRSSVDVDVPSCSPSPLPAEPRPLEECLALYRTESGAACLSDEEVLLLVKAKHIPAYKLETALCDPQRGVAVRRKLVSKELHSESALEKLPYENYNYSLVMGACCENVLGYMPIPVGFAGPLLLDGQLCYVPMSTTEGTLVASTNRGCRALSSCGGVRSCLLDDGMTRGPVVRLPSAVEAGALKLWLDVNFSLLEEVFNSTSRFAKLKSVRAAVAGRLMYIRFKATTGDAMGMNMLSKGVEKALECVKGKFPHLEVISLSGNFCTDKKPAAINWLEGRGKSVVCEATIPAAVVKQVLKTTVEALVELNISKNLVGSAMAGSIGGFNAHAANIVTAIFIATGQDPAQNIASSNCMTLLERCGPSGEDLHISCTMPSIELGTVGGGTILPAQGACLAMLGVQGSHHSQPGGHASRLAQVVCGTVLAGELSLLSALAAGHLVKSHLVHNRSTQNLLLAPIPEDHREHRRSASDSTPFRTPVAARKLSQPPAS